MCIYIGIEFHYNYISFLGLMIGSFNVMLMFNNNKHQQMNFLVLQLIHIYLYLTHLLSSMNIIK